MRPCHFDAALEAWVWPGVGRPLVAVHGFSGDGRDFEALAEQLVAPVVAPELAGHGTRRLEQDVDTYRLPAQAARLSEHVARVAEHLGTPLLLGYSLGARVAALAVYTGALAATEVVLVGAHPGLQGEAQRRERALADDALAAQAEQDLASFLDAWRRVPLMATQSRQPDPWRKQREARRALNHGPGLALSLRHAGTAHMPDLLAAPPPGVALTLLVGEQDHKFMGLAESWRQAHPAVRLRLLPGGHACHLEATDDLARWLSPRLEADCKHPGGAPMWPQTHPEPVRAPSRAARPARSPR